MVCSYALPSEPSEPCWFTKFTHTCWL